jgi:hypothetical protein
LISSNRKGNKLFEITIGSKSTHVRTDIGAFTIRYSNERRRYQVLRLRGRTVLAESYNGFQGALDIVSQFSKAA